MTTLTRRRTYTREDVTLSYHQGQHGRPMANVKVRTSMRDAWTTLEENRAAEGINHYFTEEWVEKRISDEHLDGLFWHVCEYEWEWLEGWCKEIFEDYSIEVFQDGRSGGWAVVEGLPDVEEWDAVLLSKWRKFERVAKQTAADIPFQMLMSIYSNEFEAWKCQ